MTVLLELLDPGEDFYFYSKACCSHVPQSWTPEHMARRMAQAH